MYECDNSTHCHHRLRPTCTSCDTKDMVTRLLKIWLKNIKLLHLSRPSNCKMQAELCYMNYQIYLKKKLNGAKHNEVLVYFNVIYLLLCSKRKKECILTRKFGRIECRIIFISLFVWRRWSNLICICQIILTIGRYY